MKKRKTLVFKALQEIVAAYRKVECDVEGCDKPRELRQFCGMHYARLKKAGIHPKTEPRIRASKIQMWIVDNALSQTDDCCFSWPYSINKLGYPEFTFKHKSYRVSRVMCEAVHGLPPSEEYVAAHECGNEGCINFKHLSWKTQAENIADKERHGTKLFGERHPMSLLTVDAVLEIRKNEYGLTTKQLAEKYGVKVPTIGDVMRRATWREVA